MILRVRSRRPRRSDEAFAPGRLAAPRAPSAVVPRGSMTVPTNGSILYIGGCMGAPPPCMGAPPPAWVHPLWIISGTDVLHAVGARRRRLSHPGRAQHHTTVGRNSHPETRKSHHPDTTTCAGTRVTRPPHTPNRINPHPGRGRRTCDDSGPRGPRILRHKGHNVTTAGQRHPRPTPPRPCAGTRATPTQPPTSVTL